MGVKPVLGLGQIRTTVAPHGLDPWGHIWKEVWFQECIQAAQSPGLAAVYSSVQVVAQDWSMQWHRALAGWQHRDVWQHGSPLAR